MMGPNTPIKEAQHLLAKQRKKYLIIVSLLVVATIGFISSTAYLAVKLNGAYPSARVEYHIWNHPDALKASRNEFKLKVPDNGTVFTVMEHGAKEDHRLRFEFANYGFGRYITSVGGVKENLGENKFWIVYKLKNAPRVESPPGIDSMAQLGIDDMRVKDGDIYLLWLTNTGPIEPLPEVLSKRMAKDTLCVT